MKKITFLLPGRGTNPIGGYKVVFEYSNRLAKEDYEVTLVFPITLLWKEQTWFYKIKAVIKLIYFFLKKEAYMPYSWFELDKRIKLSLVPSLNEKFIKDANYIVATSCETAEYLNKYSLKKGKKYYLIQGYENWSFSEKRLLATWKFKMIKIVISKWLQNIAYNLGEESFLLYNGLNFKEFNLDIPIEDRKKKKVIMLYHELKLKGSKIALEAIENARRRNEEIEIILFGIYKRPGKLPNYIKYYEKPSKEKLRELYNQSIIYVGASYGEGWGLTLAEAMQCGCAIVCTNAKGYNEIIQDNETGLLSEVGNSMELEKNIIKLINDDNLRIKLAKNGNHSVKKFTWEKSYSDLKKILEREEKS